MPKAQIVSLAREFSNWMERRMVSGILPPDAYDEMLGRTGHLLWTAFLADEERARVSRPICQILAILGIRPEFYVQKWLIGRSANSNGECGYWPPLPGPILQNPQLLREFSAALRRLEIELKGSDPLAELH